MFSGDKTLEVFNEIVFVIPVGYDFHASNVLSSLVCSGTVKRIIKILMWKF